MRIPANPPRKAVTQIVVEMFLIVISLIAAVLLAGLFYGLSALYTPPAEVTVQSVSCSGDASAVICQLSLFNLGVRSTQTGPACSLSVGGHQIRGAVESGGVIAPGGELSGVQCAVEASNAAVGPNIVGSVSLANGASVFFTGATS